MTGLTAANTPSQRRAKFALSILFLLSVFAAGCLRSNISLVVEESAAGSPTAELKVRTLFPLETSVMEEQSISFDGPLEGAVWVASDPDGWEGVAYDVRGPLEDVLAMNPIEMVAEVDDDSGPQLDKTDNRWNFTWQVENGSERRDLVDRMEADLAEVGIDLTSDFEFDLSVSLPGELVETSSEDVTSRRNRTTARWRLTDPYVALDFVLITETEEPSVGTDGEEDSGGLGITWVLTIVFIGIALITLFFFRIDRRISV